MKLAPSYFSYVSAALLLAALAWALPATAGEASHSLPLDSNEVALQAHQPPAEAKNCASCHSKKSRPYMKTRKDPQLEHRYFNTHHGKGAIACGSCHDGNHSNQLYFTREAPATFSNPSPVCKQCHVEIFRDWAMGIHGKRLGGWNLPKTQLNCVDCHSPHSVSFPNMKSVSPPRKPKLHRDKDE